MLAEFERQRAHQQEQEKITQEEADKLCGKIWKDTGAILKIHGKFQGTDKKLQQVIRTIGNTALSVGVEILNQQDAWKNQQYLNPDEQRRKWVLPKKVDLDGEEPQLVTLAAYGGSSPLESRRKFIKVQDASYEIELREDGGTIWEVEKMGNNTRSRRTDRKANKEDANFYKRLLERFQATP